MLVPAFRLFYVVGPMLAAWAVVLAGIGLRQPRFPRNFGAQRLVILVSILLVLGVIASATIGAKFEHTEKPAKGEHAKRS